RGRGAPSRTGAPFCRRRICAARHRCASDSGESESHGRLRQPIRCPKGSSPCPQPFETSCLRCRCREVTGKAHVTEGLSSWRPAADREQPCTLDQPAPVPVEEHGLPVPLLRHTREATTVACWVISPDRCASLRQIPTSRKLVPGLPGILSLQQTRSFFASRRSGR